MSESEVENLFVEAPNDEGAVFYTNHPVIIRLLKTLYEETEENGNDGLEN